jgi:hypothetical protein
VPIVRDQPVPGVICRKRCASCAPVCGPLLRRDEE